MKFIDLFDRMYCEFFELHIEGAGIKKVEFDRSKNLHLESFYDMEVVDIRPIKAKNSRELGLMIRLSK